MSTKKQDKRLVMAKINAKKANTAAVPTTSTAQNKPTPAAAPAAAAPSNEPTDEEIDEELDEETEGPNPAIVREEDLTDAHQKMRIAIAKARKEGTYPNFRRNDPNFSAEKA